MPPDSCDIAVIGAGCAGLSAARSLAKAGKRVVVFEARDRVGGRTHTLTSDHGPPVDVGGQWLGPGQDRALALAEELGIPLWDQYHDGAHLLHLHGRTRRFRGNIPRLGLFRLLDMQLAIWRLEAMARRIQPAAPQDSPGAAALDAISVDAWMRRHIHSRMTRSAMTCAVHAVFASETREISMLQFLAYLQNAGGLMPLISVRGGAQAWRLHGGAQQLSEGLAQQARDAGAVIRLQTPVRAVAQTVDQVQLFTADDRIHARLAITAMSPADAAGMDWGERLPAARRQLMQRMPMGSVIKISLIYPQAFWRKAGLSGELVTDGGPLRMCFDGMPASESKPGVLVGFILGSDAAHWSSMPAERRRDAILRQLADHFGEAAMYPAEFIEKDWCSDPWTSGCYVGLMVPGSMTRLAHLLREPEGRMHWAGTETATEWTGYIDGALRSGERAAREVLRRMAE